MIVSMEQFKERAEQAERNTSLLSLAHVLVDDALARISTMDVIWEAEGYDMRVSTEEALVVLGHINQIREGME